MLKRNLTQAQEDLILAKKLIEHEKFWCRGLGRHGDGRRCASVAVEDVCGQNTERYYEAMRNLAAVRETIPPLTIQDCQPSSPVALVITVNDLEGHGAVMDMFDKVIGQ